MAKEKYNPDRYVRMYRQTYAKTVDRLGEELEKRIKSAINSSHVFRILEAIDEFSEEVEGARLLRRYQPEFDIEDSKKHEGTYNVIFSDNYNSIAEILTDFRKQAGLTKTDVSRLSGISVRAVIYNESGKNNPSLTNLRRYLSIYSIEPPESIDKIEEMLK